MNLNKKTTLEVTLNEEEVVNCVEIASIICSSEYRNYGNEPAVYINQRLSEKFHKLHEALVAANIDSVACENYDKLDVIIGKN